MKECVSFLGGAKGASRRFLGMQRHEQALTRVELMIILAVLGMLAVVATPLFGNSALRSQRAVCANNLRQMATGFRAYALNNQGRYPWNFSQVPPPPTWPQVFLSAAGGASTELGSPRIVVCPSDSGRTIAVAFTNTFSAANNLSYFINVQAKESQAGTWLAGDRNISPAFAAITNGASVQWLEGSNHETEGNIVAVDGHVRALDQDALKASANVALSNAYSIYLMRP